MIKTNYITEEWKAQGIELREVDDHIVELYKEGNYIARFSQTGVKVDNILKEIEAGKYGN
jgi:hypothetical protein